VTLTDEGTIDAGVAKRRQQKLYSDVLGRTVKTEVLNWEGGSVYSATVNTYNARDQVKLVRQFQGAAPSDLNDLSCPSGTCQQTTMTYDGYARLQTKQEPEQSVGTATVYSYNTDDTVNSVADARGASSTYSYNARHLVTGINYSAPGGITPTSNVLFIYDAAGNRTAMTDGMGSTSYSYNQLSRMTSETRTLNSVGYTLNYDYNLASELKKITDATNTTINYGYDTAGRLNGVTGADNLVGGVSSYASGIQYRAWGALKQISAGATHTASFDYNWRLQANHFDIDGGVVNQNYDRYSDGRLSFVHNTTDNNFDRSYTYDHAGRLTAAASGGEARHDLGAVPMYETFAYNAWDNTTTRVNESWLNDYYDSGSYANNRRTGWGYDADGRIASIDTRTYSYDAAGQNIFLNGQRWTADGYVPTSTTSDFDGDGNRIRETSDGFGYMTTTYYLRSSILGGAIVEELNSSGQKQLGYVYTPAGGLLARQAPGNNYVSLKQISPIGASQYEFSFSTTMTESVTRREFDPVGANVPLNNHSSLGHGGAPGDVPGGGGAADSRFGALENPGAGCTLDGVWVPCDMAYRALDSGAAVLAPQQTTRYNYTKQSFEHFRAYADGYYGFVLAGATYMGNGYFIAPRGWDNEEQFLDRETDRSLLRDHPQNPVRLTSDEVDVLRQDLQGLSPKCKNFLASVISELGRLPYSSTSSSFGSIRPFSTDIGTIFEEIAKNGGFYLADLRGKAYAETNPKSFTTLLDLKLFPAPSRGGSFASLQRGIQLAHELVHIAAGRDFAYSHDQMATAARNVSLAFEFKNVWKLPLRSDFPATPEGSSTYGTAMSNYFDGLVAKACAEGP
jgi:YD repeat-containing protein